MHWPQESQTEIMHSSCQKKRLFIIQICHLTCTGTLLTKQLSALLCNNIVQLRRDAWCEFRPVVYVYTFIGLNMAVVHMYMCNSMPQTKAVFSYLAIALVIRKIG